MILLLAFSAALTTARAETSELAPLASRALLLDIAHAGDQLVAVGDHGHVLLSADNGRTWTQSLTPTRALLTGVAFADAQHGWAVGHDGVILATTDGGKTWTHQDDGRNLDTIFLDVLFLDARHGFAVGAYGKFLATADGGKTWTPHKPSADEVHYNRITAGPGGELYLAGECGLVLVSTDSGQTWTRSEVPYEGSLFGVLPLDDTTLVAYGLRGHILRSPDRGATWQPLNSELPVLIMAGCKLKNGTVVLAGQGGNFFVSRDAGRTFQSWQPAGFGTSVADLTQAADGALVTVGEAGALRVQLP
ncbi:MAG: hypothetical protein HY302_03605 [Opitutae bacterium]|nr:hypothetical protein [Opitutae bacterium]